MITGAIHNNCGTQQIEAPSYIYKIAYLAGGQLHVQFAQNAETRQP